jgi:hypothetical protein
MVVSRDIPVIYVRSFLEKSMGTNSIGTIFSRKIQGDPWSFRTILDATESHLRNRYEEEIFVTGTVITSKLNQYLYPPDR